MGFYKGAGNVGTDKGELVTWGGWGLPYKPLARGIAFLIASPRGG